MPRLLILGIMPICALVVPLLHSVSGIHLPLKYSLVAALFLALVLLAVALWRLAKDDIPLSDHKAVALGLGLVILTLAAWDVTLLTRNRAISRIGKSLAAAERTMQAKGGSPEAITEFVTSLKAIDPGFAPADFKRALRDYIQGVDDTVAAIKAKDRAKMTAADNATKAAYSRIVEITEKS
jgi:hypothetical protein